MVYRVVRLKLIGKVTFKQALDECEVVNHRDYYTDESLPGIFEEWGQYSMNKMIKVKRRHEVL